MALYHSLKSYKARVQLDTVTRSKEIINTCLKRVFIIS